MGCGAIGTSDTPDLQNHTNSPPASRRVCRSRNDPHAQVHFITNIHSAPGMCITACIPVTHPDATVPNHRIDRSLFSINQFARSLGRIPSLRHFPYPPRILHHRTAHPDPRTHRSASLAKSMTERTFLRNYDGIAYDSSRRAVVFFPKNDRYARSVFACSCCLRTHVASRPFATNPHRCTPVVSNTTPYDWLSNLTHLSCTDRTARVCIFA